MLIFLGISFLLVALALSSALDGERPGFASWPLIGGLVIVDLAVLAALVYVWGTGHGKW